MSDQTIALLLGTFGTIIAGFFKLINDQNKVHGKIAEGLTKLETSGNAQAEAMREVAAETRVVAAESKLGNQQSAERNGHLGEQNIQLGEQSKQITKLITETRADMLNAVENVNEQHIKKQVVDNQQVKNEVVEHQEVKE